jgi:hypothetical protein
MVAVNLFLVRYPGTMIVPLAKQKKMAANAWLAAGYE